VDQIQHTLAVYNLPKFELSSTLRPPGPICIVAMSDDRQALAVGFQGGASHHVLVWDLAHDARIGEFGNFETAISALTFSRDGRLLAASWTNGVVGIWDLKTRALLPTPPSSAVYHVEFTPDNKRLLSGTTWT
jgi:WD40 repeat protein